MMATCFGSPGEFAFEDSLELFESFFKANGIKENLKEPSFSHAC